MPATASASVKKRPLSNKAKQFKKRWFPKKKESISSIIKKEILRLAEKKTLNYGGGVQDVANFANTGAVASNTIPLTPYTGYMNVSQGTSSAGRIGNKIKITNANIKLMFAPNPYNATSNSIPTPQVLNVYIWKAANLTADITAARFIASNSFLQNSNASFGLTGNLRDYLFAINKDQVKILRKYTLKLGASSYTLNTGTQDNSFNYNNNDFKSCIIKTIDYTSLLDPEYTFNDAATLTSQQPIFITVSPNDFDGGIATDTTAALPCMWEWVMNYEFTDI